MSATPGSSSDTTSAIESNSRGIDPFTLIPTPTGHTVNVQDPSHSSYLDLLTFLATMLLLLLIVFAIVLRSFVLRREARRQWEDRTAELEGVIMPPEFDSEQRIRTLGEKPKIWDGWIWSSTSVHWRDIKPISAKIVFGSTVPEVKTEHATTLEPAPLYPPEPTIPDLLSSLFTSPDRLRDCPLRNLPSAVASTSIKLEELVELQVSVFIAMPHPGRQVEGELPNLSVGTARVPCPLPREVLA